MIDIRELRKELQLMTPRTQVFKAIKAELQTRGHWKNKSRGVPMQKGDDPRRDK